MSFITDITAAVPTTGVFGENGQPSGIVDNGGAIRGPIWGLESFSTNPMFTEVTFGEGNPVITIVSGVDNYQAAGGGTTWNQQSQFSDIMKATTTIGGVTNNALVFGSSDSSQGDAIHQAGTIRSRLYKTAVRAGDWNDYSGWSSAPSVVESGGYNVSAGIDNAGTLKASGTDHAANPTSARPGELTAFSASGTPNAPTNLDYKPRYLW